MSLSDIFDKIAASRQPQPTGAVEFLIVGLGNPGTQYENTRHNAGFMAVDTLADKLGVQIKKLKFKSLIADCTVEGKHCLLMKPSTFMNNSGEAVREAMDFYKLPPENILVLYDDISLDVGRTRIRRKGSFRSFREKSWNSRKKTKMGSSATATSFRISGKAWR